MTGMAICIASSGRPSLADTLQSLMQIDVPAELSVRIIVADDDPGHGAATVIAGIGTEIRFPVQVLPVGARNISIARNACLEAAAGSHIIFIDDDEWVEPDWLRKLFACQNEFSADCVFGPVHPQYPSGTPEWLVAANPLYVDWGRRGKRVLTGRCGNTLIRAGLLDQHPVRFDPALGLSGGEDTEFFGQLAGEGARLVVTDDALAYEHVPADRLEPWRLRQRIIRKGQSYARFAVRHLRAGSLSSLGFYLDAAAKLAIAGLGCLCLSPVDKVAAMRMRLKLWSNIGKLREACGLDLPQMYR